MDTLKLTGTDISFGILSKLSVMINQAGTVNELLDIRLELAKQNRYFPDLCAKLIRCVDKKLNSLDNAPPAHNRNNRKNSVRI